MSNTKTTPNGVVQHLAVSRIEPSGQFTVQVIGVPELRATAPTRGEAVEQIRTMLGDWLASGQLMLIEVPRPNPVLHFAGHLDPNDPVEQEFVAELIRRRQEELNETLREDDQEWIDSFNRQSYP